MADEVDVKIRADSSQAQASMNQFADAANDSTSEVKSALASLGARAAETARGFHSSIDSMALSAKEGGAQIKESLESIEQRLNSIHKTFALLGEIAVAGAIGDWAIEQAKSIGEYGEALSNASKETGIATDELQKLGYIGQITGLSTQEMQTAMGILSRRMAEAQGGSKQAAEALAMVGLKAADLKNLSLDQVMQRIAQSFKEHADGANKAALSMQLFGRSGRQLIPTLDEGAEGFKEMGDRAAEVGRVIDAQAIEQMAKLSEHMHQLGADAGAASMQFKSQLAGAVDAVVQSLDDFITKDEAGAAALKVLGEIIKGILVLLDGIIVGFRQFGDILIAVPKAALDVVHGDFVKALSEAPTAFHNAAAAGDEYIKTVERLYSTQKGGKTKPEEKARPAFGVIQQGSGTAKGEAAVAAAIAAANLALLKEQLQEEARANQDAYKAGAIDLDQYYRERLSIEERGLKGEMAVKRAEFAQVRAIKPQDAAEALQQKAKLIIINGQLAVLDQKYADAAIRNAREYAIALREQNDALTKIAARSTLAIGTQTIAQQKALLDERFALHEVSKRQEIASEVDLENQRFELQRAELEKERAIAQQYALSKPAELANVNAQIEQAQAEHETKMTELAAQGAEEQAKYQVEAVQSVDDAFSTMFEHIAEGHESLRKIFLDFANTVQQAISKIMAKSLTEKLLGGGTGGGDLMQGFLKMIGLGGTTAPGAAGAGGMTPLTGLGGGMSGAVGDWMKTAGLGAPGQMTTGAMTVASMTIGAIPQATVANMTVANMIAPGGGGSGGGGDMIGSLMGAAGGGGSNAYGFSLDGTDAAMSAADTAGGMALPAGLGGVASGIAMYAQGTNYVPETQLAMLHRGEAVVPARYNKPSPSALSVTNHFQIGQATDLRTQTQIASLAAASISRAARRNG